jgi:hemolysin III
MPPTPPTCIETPAERWANVITHGLGIALSIAAIAVLTTYAALHSDAVRLVTAAVFGSTLLLMYTASTCFHGARHEKVRHWFKVCDHASIYALIAGTYTPFLLVIVRGGWGWSLFGTLWGLTLVGSFLKIFFVDRFEPLSVGIYVAMGWIALLAIKPFLALMPAGALAWILAGGAFYTFGVIFFLWERLRFNHAIWHLFVLAGSICHFIAVLLYVVVTR